MPGVNQVQRLRSRAAQDARTELPLPDADLRTNGPPGQTPEQSFSGIASDPLASTVHGPGGHPCAFAHQPPEDGVDPAPDHTRLGLGWPRRFAPSRRSRLRRHDRMTDCHLPSAPTGSSTIHLAVPRPGDRRCPCQPVVVIRNRCVEVNPQIGSNRGSFDLSRS